MSAHIPKPTDIRPIHSRIDHYDMDMEKGTVSYHVVVTNADRIRAMTDEELAEFIAYSTSCETCVVRKGGSDECHNTNCSTAWLDWLKQEAQCTSE